MLRFFVIIDFIDYQFLLIIVQLVSEFKSQTVRVSNGPIQSKNARKIWPLLELLAKNG